jgi:hypothetical protein
MFGRKKCQHRYLLVCLLRFNAAHNSTSASHSQIGIQHFPEMNYDDLRVSVHSFVQALNGAMHQFPIVRCQLRLPQAIV